MGIYQYCQPFEIENKKVVYVNSYHPGHPSSDEIMESVLMSFPADSFEVNYFIMDTKRNPSEEYIQERAAQISDSIKNLKPDILIVSDDNAVKYLVNPYFAGTDLPVVFCGVNVSASQYNLPAGQVTGMLEILPLAELLELTRSYYPGMSDLLILTENTTTSRKQQQMLDTLFDRLELNVSYEMINDFESWKLAFITAADSYDAIYMPTNGAILGWDDDEAVRHVKEYIKVPLLTCEDFMMPYVVLGVTKIASEHGTWAASTAKRILLGNLPSDIPVTRNQQSVTWLNSSLADQIGFHPDSSLVKQAKMVTLSGRP